MNFLDELKQRVKRALARFAARKTEEQAQGMVNEAKGIVASTKNFARTNPIRFAALVGFGAVLLWLLSSRKGVQNAA